MTLYLLRHGKAWPRSRKWDPDSARPLTRDGEKKMFEAARGIRALGVEPDLILTSPYLRAFRTAEILGEVLSSNKISETKNLAAEAPPEDIVGEITASYSEAGTLVLAGHEPFLSGLASILLTGTASLAMDLRKGGLVKLEVKKLRFGRCAKLEWLLTPRQLAKIGRKGKRA